MAWACQRRIGGQDLCGEGFLNGKERSVSSLPTNIRSILVTTTAWVITIPVTLYKMENWNLTETTALIDSGATICCIDLHLAWRMKWPLEKLLRPMHVWNVDGTNNAGGMIWYHVKLSLRIKEPESTQDFYVLDLGGKNNVILGYPWLTWHNPLINWTEGTIHLKGTPVPRHDGPEVVKERYLLWYLGAFQHNLWLTVAIAQQQKKRAICWRILSEEHPSLQNLTLSTAFRLGSFLWGDCLTML